MSLFGARKKEVLCCKTFFHFVFHFQDGVFLPFENVLNYESFAVRVREDEIPNLIRILRVIFLDFNVYTNAV